MYHISISDFANLYYHQESADITELKPTPPAGYVVEELLSIAQTVGLVSTILRGSAFQRPVQFDLNNHTQRPPATSTRHCSSPSCAGTFVNTEHNHRRLTQDTEGDVRGEEGFRFEAIPDGLSEADRGNQEYGRSVAVATARGARRRSRTSYNEAQLHVGRAACHCVLPTMLMSFALQVAWELSIPTMVLWTASAASLMAHRSLSGSSGKEDTCRSRVCDHDPNHTATMIQTIHVLNESFLTNGYLEKTVIDWIPGMPPICIGDLSNFIRTTDPDDFRFHFYDREKLFYLLIIEELFYHDWQIPRRSRSVDRGLLVRYDHGTGAVAGPVLINVHPTAASTEQQSKEEEDPTRRDRSFGDDRSTYAPGKALIRGRRENLKLLLRGIPVDTSSVSMIIVNQQKELILTIAAIAELAMDLQGSSMLGAQIGKLARDVMTKEALRNHVADVMTKEAPMWTLARLKETTSQKLLGPTTLRTLAVFAHHSHSCLLSHTPYPIAGLDDGASSDGSSCVSTAQGHSDGHHNDKLAADDVDGYVAVVHGGGLAASASIMYRKRTGRL
ncbi:hypothetical protein HU200_013863 [Digitaria exilis]|uniref:Uncharacterized protein n=1 Tax=Digitaria exilis TaxID=1010633 RepID=A0A835KNF4_9POAL|nr:hypothetical protein HU200_013863 [Digitaria exilis]